MQLTVSRTYTGWHIMLNQREIPSQFKSVRGREVESTKAFYDHSNGILLIFYILKRNINVLMMSSSHSDVSITNCRNKPTVIMDYNKHKRWSRHSG